jgi:hypothetical protein
MVLAMGLPGSLPEDLRNVDQMSAETFKSCLALMTERNGYGVELLPPLDDYGADLILSAESVRIAVQGKRSNQPVGIGAVRAIAAARTHYHCDQATVITNHYFSTQATTLAKSAGIALWDRGILRRALIDAGMLDLTRPPVAPVCWNCGISFVVRSGRHGSFFGCPNSPRCRRHVPRSAEEPLWLAAPEPGPSLNPGVLLSSNKRLWWDGIGWQDTATAAPPGAQRSADGHYWWDGETWRTVPQGGHS